MEITLSACKSEECTVYYNCVKPCYGTSYSKLLIITLNLILLILSILWVILMHQFYDKHQFLLIHIFGKGKKINF